MNTRAIVGVASVVMFTMAQAQTGNPTTPTKDNAEINVQTDQGPVPVHSMYHECLLTAGKSTWMVLGLNEDQMTQVTALQAKYKADLVAATEEAAKAEKGKDGKAVPAKSAAVKESAKDPVPTATPEERPMALDQQGDLEDKFVRDPNAAPVAQDKTAIALESTEVMVNNPEVGVITDPQGSELAGILTPEQWNLFNKQCYMMEPIGYTK